MADDVVSVQVTADVGGVVSGMKQAADAVGGSTTAMRDSFGRFVASSNEATAATDVLKHEVESFRAPAVEASEGMSGFASVIKEYRQEVRTEGRYSRFLAGDIASMGIASKGAAGEVTMLVSAFAFGGGFGVAVEAVKMVVKAIMELNAEEGKFKDEVKKIWADATTAVASFHDEINKTVLALGGASQVELTWVSKVPPLLRQQADLKQELIQKELALSKAREDAKFSTQSEQELTAAVKNEADAVELVTQRLAAKTEEIAQAHEEIKKLKAAVDTIESEKQDSDAAATTQQQNKILLQLKAQLLTGEEKLEAEYAVKLQAIEDDSALTIRQREARVAAESMIYVKQVVDYRNEQEAKWNSDLQRWRGENLKLELEASKKIKELLDSNDKARLDMQQRQDKHNEDAAKAFIKDFAHPVEAAFTSSIKGMLLNGQSFADVLTGLFKGLAGAAIDGFGKMAEKSIASSLVSAATAKAADTSSAQGNIAVAATGAASAVASIPLIGPALSLDVAATEVAALEAIAGPLLSAAGGIDSVPRDGMLFELHKKETVLSAPLSDGFRNIIASHQDGGAGGGAQDIHIHNHFEAGTIVDQQTLDNHMQSGAMQQAISRAVRMSKWRG